MRKDRRGGCRRRAAVRWLQAPGGEQAALGVRASAATCSLAGCCSWLSLGGCLLRAWRGVVDADLRACMCSGAGHGVPLTRARVRASVCVCTCAQVPGTAAEFFTSMHRILRYAALGPVKSFCHHR